MRLGHCRTLPVRARPCGGSFLRCVQFLSETTLETFEARFDERIEEGFEQIQLTTGETGTGTLGEGQPESVSTSAPKMVHATSTLKDVNGH